MRFIVIVICFLTVSACTLPDTSIDPKKLYAITCTISPQDPMLTAYVYKGQPLETSASPTSAIANDALVTISDGGSMDTLAFSPENTCYQAVPKNIIVRAGSSYSLRTVFADGTVLAATCSIPLAPEVPETTGEFIDEHYFFSTKWANPTHHQYFMLIPFAYGFYEAESPQGLQIRQLTARITDDLTVPSDELKGSYKYNGVIGKAAMADSVILSIKVSNVDEGYYKFITSFKKYEDWQANNEGQTLPNFLLPQAIYTNVTGGAGIFAGMNTIERVVRVK